MKHEAVLMELNPIGKQEMSFNLANGLTFIHRNYATSKNDLVVQVHHWYKNSNLYTISSVPSHWLNDTRYMQNVENEYFVKYVHELDMSENS